MYTQFTFLSSDKTHQIQAKKWIPEGSIKAIIQIVHGMNEYIDRYQDFASYLNQKGFLVVGYDMIGHGDSAKKDELGYFGCQHVEEVLVDDIKKMMIQIKKEYPNIPYYLLGHSFGSFLVRIFLSKCQEELNGVIIMGSGQIKIIDLYFGYFMTKLLMIIHDEKYRSTLIKRLTFNKNYHKFDTTGKDLSRSWLTSNQTIVKQYYEDKYCSYVYTLEGYYHIFKVIEWAMKAKIKDQNKTLPILIVSGENDPVGERGKGVKKIFGNYQIAQVKDIQCKIYENKRHEILNEIGNQEVYKDIYQWMKERMK